MATVVQMRRSDSSIASAPPVSVTLIGPHGNTVSSVEFTRGDSEAICDAVERAQTKAVELSGSEQFIDDHTIQVHVEGPDLVDVTLVDLPGFHTADDRDTQTVNDMVKRYIEMPGTLVLHVVKGDQDYASLLGNDFMRQASSHGNARVTVLTHCDNLSAGVEQDATRLRTTLDAASKNSALAVALLGCAKSDEEETAALTHLTAIDDRIRIGRIETACHLEDQMSMHLSKQFSKAVSKLRESYDDTCSKLNKVRKRHPTEVMHELATTINENFRAKKRRLLNDSRKALESMTMEIKNFMLKPIHATAYNYSRRDQFSEALEPGARVAVKEIASHRNFTINEIKGSDITMLEKDKDGFPCCFKTNKVIYSLETASADDIVEDIKKLAERRGMRNIAHADRQEIIAAYAQKFAEYYSEKIADALEEICNILDSFYDDVFSNNIIESALPVANRLRELMDAEEEETYEIAKSAAEGIAAYNKEPDLIFTPNEHYLNSLIQQMVAADDAMSTDSGGARHIFHNVRAYIKVQRKAVSEMASKEIIRTTILETERRFHKLLKSNMGSPDMLELIQEPTNVARKRELFLNQKKVLEEALAVVSK